MVGFLLREGVVFCFLSFLFYLLAYSLVVVALFNTFSYLSTKNGKKKRRKEFGPSPVYVSPLSFGFALNSLWSRKNKLEFIINGFQSVHCVEKKISLFWSLSHLILIILHHLFFEGWKARLMKDLSGACPRGLP